MNLPKKLVVNEENVKKVSSKASEKLIDQEKVSFKEIVGCQTAEE